MIQFGQLIAFLFDPLILHQPQLRQGISSIIMGQLSVQNLGQFWMQFNTKLQRENDLAVIPVLRKIVIVGVHIRERDDGDGGHVGSRESW